MNDMETSPKRQKTFGKKKKSFEPEKYINEKFTKEIEKVDLNKKKEKKGGTIEIESE